MVMRPGQWEPLIDEASQRFGVPQDIIMRVMGVESGGRRDAVSPKGAAGLMQLMAPTYTELARKHDLGPDRFDPRNNVMAGTAYLRENYDRFGGDWGKALAAYNAGPSRVESGRPLPAETQAYVPKVLDGFGGNKTQEADVAPGLIRPRPGQTTGMGPMFGAARPNQSLTGLLEVDDANNFHEGLGNLLNFGQTESQPPRTDPAAMPGTTQTDRMDVSGRINELLQQYMQQGPQKPALSPMQYQLAGAGSAVGKLAGVHDRQIGIGEMLGALGGGLTSGTLAGDEAQRQQQGSELDKLLKIGGYQNQNRTAALNEASSIIDNRYKAAATEKLQRPEAPETYTLAPGAQRRDAAGNIVAENPPAPPTPRQAQTVQTAEGVFVLNPDGTTGARVGSPVSAVQKQTPQEREAILQSDQKLEAGVATIGTLRQALALNKKAFDGPTAGARALLDRWVPGEWGGTVTTEFQNLIETGLLTQMKDIFGANPTEGERKVLLDLGASVNKTAAEREVIITNAIAAAEARVKREQQRADSLRQGTYYTEGIPAPSPGGGGSGGGNAPDPLGIR